MKTTMPLFSICTAVLLTVIAASTGLAQDNVRQRNSDDLPGGVGKLLDQLDIDHSDANVEMYQGKDGNQSIVKIVVGPARSDSKKSHREKAKRGKSAAGKKRGTESNSRNRSEKSQRDRRRSDREAKGRREKSRGTDAIEKSIAARKEALKEAWGDLEKKSEKLGKNHPEIRKATKEIAAMKREMISEMRRAKSAKSAKSGRAAQAGKKARSKGERRAGPERNRKARSEGDRDRDRNARPRKPRRGQAGPRDRQARNDGPRTDRPPRRGDRPVHMDRHDVRQHRAMGDHRSRDRVSNQREAMQRMARHLDRRLTEMEKKIDFIAGELKKR